MSDLFGLVANLVSDRALRTGAKVWILGWNGDAENAQVRGISKGGRTITKYIRLKRLEKFRAAWIPDRENAQMGRYSDLSQRRVANPCWQANR